MSHKKSAVEYHNRIAQTFGQRYGTSARFAERLEAWRTVIRNFVVEGAVVADMGCGPGHLTALVASRASRVFAVDGSAEMLREAQLTCQGLGNVEFRQAMLEDLRPVELPPLDAILCSSVLEYIPTPDSMVERWKSALKPGGLLIFSVPNGDSWYRLLERATFRFFGKPRYLAHATSTRWTELQRRALVDSGFEIQAVLFYGAAPLVSPIFRILQLRRWSDTLVLMVVRQHLRAE